MNGEPIDVYSISDAIRDEVLIPAPADLIANAGFGCAVVFTAAAWADTVAWEPADNQRKGTVQDQTGRCWDVLWMTRHALGRHPNPGDSATVEVHRVPRAGRGVRPVLVRLTAYTGTDIDGTEAITIAMPGED